MKEIIIAPSIISCDFSHMEEELKKIEEGGAGYVHFDVMDGHFVPNLTIGPDIVFCLRDKTDLVFDIHLMILHPGKFIERFMDAGGDVITFHIEVLDDPISLINTIRERDKKVGIALNPDTPISKVCNFLDLIDTILIMTVNPGFSGQNFMKCVIPKIKFLKEDIIQRKLNLTIEVDGGIKEDNIYSVVEAGADIVVSGSGVFGGGDPGGAIRVLKERAKEGFRKSRMGIL